MEKNIEDLSTEEMQAALAVFAESYATYPDYLSDEEKYSSEELVDLLTLISYLKHSGAVPNAEEVYSDVYKNVGNELLVRLGEVPYLT